MAGRRSRPKFLSIIALAAILLAAQIALTAGHLHFSHALHHASAASVAAHGKGDHAPAEPAKGDDGRLCPLCWAQSANASLLVPLPPELVLPVSTSLPGNAARPDDRDGSDPAAGFNPRAPPGRALI